MKPIRVNYMSQKHYCEDCAFYNRSVRPNSCSAPKNLIEKKYENLVTRRIKDPYKERYTPGFMRRQTWVLTRILRVCGMEGRWFIQATKSDIEARARNLHQLKG